MGEETVVDRVARMLYEGAYERRFYPMCDWAKLSDGGRARWLDDAAAILNAVADAVEYQPIVGSMDIANWLRSAAKEH